MKYYNPIDLNQNELKQGVLENLAAAPTNPKPGQAYFDTTLNTPRFWSGTEWLSNTANDAVAKTYAATVADILQVSGGADRSIKDFTPSVAGILKTDSMGVPSIAAAGIDYVAATTGTAVQKANGTGGLTDATAGTDYAPATASTSALKGNGAGGFDNATLNDVLSPTADYSMGNNKLTDLLDPVDPQDAATKSYVDAKVTSGMTLKGTIDGSLNPAYPVPTPPEVLAAGQYWVVASAGTVGGEPVGMGDLVLCTDATLPQYEVIQNSSSYATELVAGNIKLATVAETEAKIDASKAVTPADLVSFPVKRTFLIGDGTTASLECLHNLGTQDVVVSVIDATTKEAVMVDWTASDVNTVMVNFADAPAAQSYKVVIVG